MYTRQTNQHILMDESFLYYFLFVCYLVCCPFEPRYLQLSTYFFIYFSFPYCLFNFVLHFCWWPNRYPGIYFIRGPLLDVFFIYVFTVFTHHLGWRVKKNGGENFCCGWDSPAHNHCDVTGARFWAQQLQGAVPVPDSQHQHQQNFGRNAQNWCQIRHRPGTGTMSVETR